MAFLTPGIWRSAALPMTCQAASPTLTMAVAPMGLVEMTPPEGLTGMMPSMWVAPLRMSLGACPLSQNHSESIHLTPQVEHGMYSSATSSSLSGLVIPAYL